MFAEWLPVDRELDEPALITAREQVTWRQFQRRLDAHCDRFQRLCGRRVGLQLSSTTESLIRFFSLVSIPARVFLIAAEANEETIAKLSRDFDLTTVIRADGTEVPPIFGSDKLSPETPREITILTSGTTGIPKAVQHSWESLTRPVRRMADASRDCWLLTYRPHLYAGLQVMLQCLLNRGTLVLPTVGDTADEVARLARESRVEYASATPSYWRWLLTTAAEGRLSKIPLKQVTLGGEAVDQAVLDALKRVFPRTRLVHIYATTELGRCFSVTDGMAGFPSRFLDQVSADGVELRVIDGELVVRSANAMAGYDRADTVSPRKVWFHTGDLVEVVDDRVRFVGRTTEMINVGGNKVYPLEVETAIRQAPGVRDVRVYGQPSSIVGQLVCCDLVIEPGCDAAEVEDSVRRITRTELNSFQQPRIIAVVDEIPRTDAGKVDRG